MRHPVLAGLTGGVVVALMVGTFFGVQKVRERPVAYTGWYCTKPAETRANGYAQKNNLAGHLSGDDLWGLRLTLRSCNYDGRNVRSYVKAGTITYPGGSTEQIYQVTVDGQYEDSQPVVAYTTDLRTI